MTFLDAKRRKIFARCENKRKLLQAVSENKNFKKSMRWWAFVKKSALLRQGSRSRIHNFCIETNRSRSIIGFYKLSRLRLRKYATRGELPFIKKASW